MASATGNSANDYVELLAMYEQQFSVPKSVQGTAKRMGLDSAMETLLCAPARYEDLSNVASNVNDALEYYNKQLIAEPDTTPMLPILQCKVVRIREAVTFQGRPSKYPFAKNVNQLKIEAVDKTGQALMIGHFGSPFVWKDIIEDAMSGADDYFYVRCAPKRFGPSIWLSNAEILPDNMIGKIRPVYLGVAGKVAGEKVAQAIGWCRHSKEVLKAALNTAATRIRMECGSIPDKSIIAATYPDPDNAPANLIYLLSNLHAPKSLEMGVNAALCAKKITSLAIRYQSQVANTRAPCAEASFDRFKANGAAKGLAFKYAEDVIAQIEKSKGYPLTENQRQVGCEILEDLFNDRPLNGLLNGEVGSGKTVAYAIPAITAHKLGAKVMIQAPTELLADQIAREIALMSSDDVAVCRVPTGQKKLENRDAILVGTIGINSVAKRSKYSPDLIISDEQHKLHTMARTNSCAAHTHTLEVSATPVPRSVALSLSDGMKSYSLNEQPVKKEINTSLIDTTHRRKLVHEIDQTITENARVAIVFARISASVDEKEGSGIYEEFDEQSGKVTKSVAKSSALEGFEAFKKKYGAKVGLLHGQMKDDEKKAALDKFRTGETPILITTTIIETGIDVPDVKMIIVRDAQCMGLSQLHQLRGRIARNGGQGTCTLMVEDIDALSEKTRDRLLFFAQNNDGYDLALADLIMRGAGEILGDKGSGKTKTLFKGLKFSVRDLLDVDDDQVFVLQQEAEHSPQAYQEHRQSPLFA